MAYYPSYPFLSGALSIVLPHVHLLAAHGRHTGSEIFTKQVFNEYYSGEPTLHSLFLPPFSMCVISKYKFFNLTHCILVDSSTAICWTSPFGLLRVLGLFCHL